MPHYAHLLIDQTQVGPDELRGELLGRIAQLAMMAGYRASWPVLQRLVPLLAELAHVGGSEGAVVGKRVGHLDRPALFVRMLQTCTPCRTEC